MLLMLPCAFFADSRLSVPSVHFNPFSQSFQLYLFLIHSISCRSLTTFSSFIFLSLLLPVFRKKLGQGKWMKNRLEIIRKQIVSSFVFCVLQYARCWWFVVRHLSYAQYRHWLVFKHFCNLHHKTCKCKWFRCAC